MTLTVRPITQSAPFNLKSTNTLQDVLDEFDPKPSIPTEPKPTAPTASGPGRPDESAITDEDDLSKQLQAGMSSLISELGENPEMQKQFEDMMQELIAAGAAPTTEQAAEHVKRASESMPEAPVESVKSGGSSSKKEQANFQDTIRKTMERMQQSDTSATATSASKAEPSEEEMLAEMLKSLSGSGGLGEGGEEDFNKMLLNMMTQLTNKEILYEPMKELHDKFPAWMESHKDTEKKEDMERFREQQRLVGEIVGRFERKGYSDDNESDRDYIVERMQKVSRLSWIWWRFVCSFAEVLTCE